MYLDYSKLQFDSNGIPETPELVLKTMSNEVIGTIPGVSNLKLNIKFAEPSEISFDVAAVVDGEENWIYDKLRGHKIVYTENYGIYVVMNPSNKADGISDVKHINGYSLERTLSSKKFFLEEGTFKFFNRTNARDENTIIGRVLEIAQGWSIGTIDSSLAQRYRTFDQYDDYLLSFLYGDAKEKFRAVFVFNPYAKTISAYDADEPRRTVPIYLDFDNLVNELSIEEQSDELVTALRPYGADELDIRDVNPIGSNWIYDLSYFISEGDLPDALADKWSAWQRSILNNQMYYKGLVALQASATARLLAAQAKLADLQGELETLKAQQSVTIQALALETTAAGKASQQAVLNEINTKISAKNTEISTQESVVQNIQSELDVSNTNSYPAQIKTIVNQLAIDKYFTTDEYATLSNYFIEQDITEDTFIATSVDTTVSGTSYTITNETMQLTGSVISMVDLSSKYNKKMYVLTGGTFAMSGNYAISGDIIRGTIELSSSNAFVMSIYAGSISTGTATAQSGLITMSGTAITVSSNVTPVTVDGVTTNDGTYITMTTKSASMYLTANVSDYQKYSVEMELFDYATNVLGELATPTYEFTVDSGNFIFAKEFAPFRNDLELGCGVYLNVGEKRCITPYIIEFSLDFENRDKFSIVFSNRFKRYDETTTLKDMIEKSYSASRSITTNHHAYNEAATQASAVSKFMQESIESAVNTIIAAKNQSVIIDGSGINIAYTDSSDPYVQKFQMRLVNGMIAMTKDNWSTVDVAIGVFKTSSGYHEGVNAHVLSGELIVGNDLIIENPSSSGIMQFKVDSSGAWLNNSTFVVQADAGGKFILDPKYGFAAGTSSLFSVDGTTVSPTFIDSNGSIITDNDGMPRNANFYLDHRNGNAYFRGKIIATSGSFSGELKAATGTFSGDITAATGTFKGTVQASRFLDSAGNNMMSKENGKFDPEYLNLKGLNVNNRFIVDSNGNVTITNGSISWSAVTGTGEIDNRITTAQNRADSAYAYADDAYDLAYDNQLPSYIHSTYIDSTTIYAPTIYSDKFSVIPQNTADDGAYTGGFSLYAYYGRSLREMMKITYFNTDGYVPTVIFGTSSIGAWGRWTFPHTDITGSVSFNGAVTFSGDVTGITAKFG